MAHGEDLLPPAARDLLDAGALFACACIGVSVAYAGLVVGARLGRGLAGWTR